MSRQPSTRDTASGEHPRILIVDHDPSVRSALASALRGEGYTVQAVESGADVLVLVAELPFDLLLCATELGDGSGLELLPDVREIAPLLRVVLMTESPEKLGDVGPHAVLATPVATDALLALARSLTERGEASSAAHPVLEGEVRGPFTEALMAEERAVPMGGGNFVVQVPARQRRSGVRRLLRSWFGRRR